MLHQATAYAIRALAAIALRGGRPAGVKATAQAAGAPAAYLAKIVNLLARRGMVRTQRGGGACRGDPACPAHDACAAMRESLGRFLRETTVADVVAFESGRNRAGGKSSATPPIGELAQRPR